MMLRGKKRNVLVVFLAMPGPVYGNITMSFTGPPTEDMMNRIKDTIAEVAEFDAGSIIILNIINLA